MGTFAGLGTLVWWRYGQDFHAMAEYALGWALWLRGNTDGAILRLQPAIVAYHKALALEPSNTVHHLQLGELLASGGDTREGVQEYREAVRSSGTNGAGWARLGLTLAEEGQHSEAITALQKAVVPDPKDPSLHHHLGNELYQNRNLDGAIEQFHQALTLKEDWSYHKDLARALRGKVR